MNPHPCGYLTDTKHSCRCTLTQIQRYRSKISGPLLDRIDMHVEVPAVPHRDLTATVNSEPSTAIADRVSKAREFQSRRFARSKIHSNARMNSRNIKTHCRIDADCRKLLQAAIDKLGLSARAYNRILKIARTIADLEGASRIGTDHISEAIQYRNLDRGGQFYG